MDEQFMLRASGPLAEGSAAMLGAKVEPGTAGQKGWSPR